MDMKAYAEFKKMLRPGMILECTDHWLPEFVGHQRIITKVTRRYYTYIPRNHSHYPDDITVQSYDHYVVGATKNDDGSFTIENRHSKYGDPRMMTLRSRLDVLKEKQ